MVAKVGLTPLARPEQPFYTRDRKLLGPLVSGRFLLAMGWAITVALAIKSALLVWTTLFPIQ
jgi:hypothetical protein